jgi:hypothetical protein
MSTFGEVPFTTGHETVFVGGVMLTFSWSYSGKGTVTITVGDPFDIITEKLSPAEFAVRKSEALAAKSRTAFSTILCGKSCEEKLTQALASGENRLSALEDYRNCVRACSGLAPE